MIRMSRRGWNNVLIFVSIFMILLFSGVHQKLLNNSALSDEDIPLLPSHHVILTLDLPNYSIERSGKQWQLRPYKELDQAELGLVIKTWISARSRVVPEQDASMLNETKRPDWVAIAWFAGQAKGYVLAFYHTDKYLLVYDQQREQWLQLERNLSESLRLGKD